MLAASSWEDCLVILKLLRLSKSRVIHRQRQIGGIFLNFVLIWNVRFFQFFDYFGTHYVMQAQLGGTVRREELADIRNFTKLDEDYVKTQFGISFR